VAWQRRAKRAFKTCELRPAIGQGTQPDPAFGGAAALGQQLDEFRSAAGAHGGLVLCQPVPKIVGSAASVAQPPRLTVRRA
jgi:hypothetical protein